MLPNTALAGVSAVDAHTAWAAGSNGVILKTTDGGANWFQQAQGVLPTAQFSAVSAFDRNSVWAVGQESAYLGAPVILHSSDGGSTWQRQGRESLPGGVEFAKWLGFDLSLNLRVTNLLNSTYRDFLSRTNAYYSEPARSVSVSLTAGPRAE